jgi:CDP-ribitol ribitolphosphotransferase
VSEGRARGDTLQRVAMKLAMPCLGLLYGFVSLFARRADSVLFFTESRDHIGSSMKILFNRIGEVCPAGRFRLRVCSRSAYGGGSALAVHFLNTIALARASTIILDDYSRTLSLLKPRRGTKVIQLWHGGAGFKLVGYAAFGRENSPHPAVSAHRKNTYGVVQSGDLVDVFSAVFGMEPGALLPFGSIKHDGYFADGKEGIFKQRFYGQHPELKNKNIILFAPTYRGKPQGGAYTTWIRSILIACADFAGRIASCC